MNPANVEAAVAAGYQPPTGVPSRGGNPNAADSEGYTVLCEAARAGALDLVRSLLQHGARPADGGPDGTPLMLAIGRKHAAVAHCLLDWSAVTGGDVGIHVRNTAGCTALHLSMYGPGISVVRRLLEAGADPDTRCLGNWSPLTAAADSEDGLGFELQAAEALIDRGAALELKTEPGGCTALLHACFRKNYDIAALLVRRGADVNATTAAGHGALAKAHVYPIELVRLLLDAGADPNLGRAEVNDPMAAWTVLQVAISAERADVVAELLRHGADVNRLPTVVRSALYVAAIRKNRNITRMLLDAGAKTDIGSNPLGTDWNFIASAALQWRRDAEAELERERAAHAATQEGFRFALPHLLAASNKRPRHA